MESINRDNIMTHMRDNAIFIKAQHWFGPGRSCVTQFLEVIELWTRIVDVGGVVGAIYFDFAMAFDTVRGRGCFPSGLHMGSNDVR